MAGEDWAGLVIKYFTPMFKDVGTLQKLELTKREELGDDIVYSYDATFANKQLKLHYAVGPGDKVSSFLVAP